MRCIMKIPCAAAAIAMTSFHMNGDGDASGQAAGRGAIVSIGESPIDTTLFLSSTCDEDGFGDCGAEDAQGRHYAIFEAGHISDADFNQGKFDDLKLMGINWVVC